MRVKCSIQDGHVDPSEEIVFAFNTELAERCLKCERAIADAMRGEPGRDDADWRINPPPTRCAHDE